MWNKFVDEWSKEVLDAGFVELSQCCELSLHSEEFWRIHFHTEASNLKHMKGIVLGSIGDFAFDDVVPDVQVVNGRLGKVTSGVQRGHSYCQVQKIGQLWVKTNYSRRVAFVCRASWVLGWWHLRKMTRNAARQELWQNRDSVVRSMAEIDAVAQSTAQQSMLAKRRRILNAIQGYLRPFKEYEKVERWKEQYTPDKFGKLTRFDFLVFVGPSKMGKSQLAASLFGPDKTFVTQCQNVEEPNLNGWDREKHPCIVFDEAPWWLIFNNKVMFQAGADEVCICQSKCQQFAKRRLLYQVAMVVCTNEWVDARTPSGAAEWIAKNCVLQEITEPVYL